MSLPKDRLVIELLFYSKKLELTAQAEYFYRVEILNEVIWRMAETGKSL